MAAYSALTAFALTILPPGRASVLAFSTPIWVVPLAAWWLHERASPAALLGTGLGLLGVLAIAAPALHPDGGKQVFAYAMLLAAAVSWAISIVAVRAHRFTATALALAPWQTLVAACLLLPVALVVEGVPRPVRTQRRGIARLRRSGRNRLRLLGGRGNGPPFQRPALCRWRSSQRLPLASCSRP